MQQRCGDAQRHHGSRTEIGQRRTQAHRQATGLARHVHQPGDRLHDRVVRRPGRVRAGLPEGRGARVNDLRIDGTHGLVADAQAIHRAGAKVLDDHVGRLCHAQKHRLASRRLQIEPQAALVPVLRHELHAFAVHELVAQVAGEVAARRLFDLNDVGAQIAEQHGADRTGRHDAQVEDGVAAQRHWFGLFAHGCLLACRAVSGASGPLQYINASISRCLNRPLGTPAA